MTKTRILVVDDELFVRELLEEFFSKLDYHVDTAKCAEEALELLAENDYAAALFDLRLPSIDGVQLLEQLRAQGNPMPVVFMTGYPTVESAIGALRGHAHDYVLKPFRLKELETTIAAAISAKEGLGSGTITELLTLDDAPEWSLDSHLDRAPASTNRLLRVPGDSVGGSAKRLRLAQQQPASGRA